MVLIDYLHRVSVAHPERMILVDYLNMIASADASARNMADICASLSFACPMAPIVIITKIIHGPTDGPVAYIAATSRWANVVIIVCGDKPCVSGGAGDAMAEMDDHLIVTLAVAGTLAGCAPAVISHDRYRNCATVAKGIGTYPVTIYVAGEEVRDVIDWPTSAESLTGALADCLTHVPCGPWVIGQVCTMCYDTGQWICAECSVCARCRHMLASRLSSLPPLTDAMDVG
jgi:hypothetical protein